MEPFGLFNLLNSLLTAAPKTPKEEAEVPPSSPPQKEQAAEPPSTPPNARIPSSTSDARVPSSTNACTAFFEAHDKRAHKKR